MKRILAFLCALLCLALLCACKEDDPPAAGDPLPENAPFTVSVPEWRMISVWHLPQGEGEREEDCSVFSDAFSSVYFEELAAEIESSAFTPDPEAEFDYSEYYDINFYSKTSLQQYRISVSVNDVVSVEKQFCRVSDGAFSFARVGGYFEMFRNLPAAPAVN